MTDQHEESSGDNESGTRSEALTGGVVTIFECSTCGTTHSNEGAACPQVFKLTVDGAPLAPPQNWRRRYFCGLCSRQPTDGYDLVGILRHHSEHVEEHLREVVLDAHWMRKSLETIGSILESPMATDPVAFEAVKFAVGRQVKIGLNSDPST